MNRNKFIKTLGLTGAAAAIPLSGFSNGKESSEKSGECLVVPSETAGPFPLDLTENVFFFRQDIREDRVGVPLRLRIRVLGHENCAPMPNVRVNIWHCDRDGNYSGYGTEEGLTYLRGYQMTDANGEIEFLTAFPGWYPGRVNHIHFQVYVNSSYAAVSQFTFDHEAVNNIYASYPVLYPAGLDPLTPESDFAFVDGYDQQLSTLEAAEVPEEYDAFYEVTVQGSGVTGLPHLERMTAMQVELQQNFPNPFRDETQIPFVLRNAAEVTLEIWHPSGSKVKTVSLGNLNAGEHNIPINFSALQLAPASYLYQLVVLNDAGRFVVSKRMTILK